MRSLAYGMLNRTTSLLTQITSSSVRKRFQHIGELKLKSSLTLFSLFLTKTSYLWIHCLVSGMHLPLCQCAFGSQHLIVRRPSVKKMALVITYYNITLKHLCFLDSDDCNSSHTPCTALIADDPTFSFLKVNNLFFSLFFTAYSMYFLFQSVMNTLSSPLVA